MGRILFLVALVSGANACGVTVLNACGTAADTVVNGGIAQGKPALCAALGTYEACLIANAADCDAATTTLYRDKVTAVRTKLSGVLGVECLDAGSTTGPPLVSGDSGSPSGSETSASSGSTSGFLPWQLVLIVLLCVCCVCGGGGGGYYFVTQNKKSKTKKKGAPAPPSGRQDYEMPLQEQQYDQATPMASAMCDTNGDGITDSIAYGVDMNRDGIPDALEGGSGDVLFEPLPPMVPLVDTEAEPNLFGPMTNLLPGVNTGSTITTAAPAAYQMAGSYSAQPTYGAYGAYGGSSYVSGSNYVGGASQYAAAPQMASNYYTSSANPTYATTAYAAPGAYTGAGAVI